MITADIYRALERCKRGVKHFEGCNLLLQLWLVEHLLKGLYHQEFPRSAWNDHIAFHHPKQMTYIPKRFAQPESASEWVEFFNNLTEEHVQWIVEWFPTDEFIIGSRDAPHLVLIRLRRIYPFVPMRVVRQAGRKQVVPRVVKMSHFRADFQEDDVSYKCQAQQMLHCKVIVEKTTVEPNRYHAGCEPLYPAWLEEI